MNKDLKDHGPKPFVVDIEKLTVDNKNYRTVIWTGKYMQMTVMSIPPGEDIGLELHKDHDQFIRIEEGEGIVQMGDAEDNLDFQEKVEDDFAILIPAGKWHNLVNNSTEPLKLYSIYSPVEHPKNTVHKTKQGEITKHFSGGKLSNHTNINMKFNKEKIKKFASGGKSPQEIMAEARRNQQMYRDEIAATTPTVTLPSVTVNTPASPQRNWTQTDRDVYNANIAGPTLNVRPTMGSVSNQFNSALNWDNLTFDQAFARARRAGLKEFTYQGRRIAVELAENSVPDNRTYDGGTLPEVTVWGRRSAPSAQPTQSTGWSQVQAPQQNLGTIGPNPRQGRRIDWGGIRRRFSGLNQGALLYQQGGVLQNNDELYADFAIRLLSALGVDENEILVNGELNPKHSDTVVTSIGEVDSPEFWEAYSQNPDQVVAEYVNSKSQEGSDVAEQQESEIEFARKGAALKQLRKNKKALTCKCGCKMTSKRQGGKLVTKCSCGCKN